MRLTCCSLLLLASLSSLPAAAAFPPAIETVRIALRTNNVDGAVAAADQAVAALPKSADAWHVAAGAYGRMAQTASIFSKMSWAKKCREAYLTAVTLDPRHFEAQLDLLQYYLMAPAIAGGGRDKAEAQVASVAKLDAGWGHSARAALARADKDEAAFEREARAAIAQGPREPRHRVNLVMMLAGRERYADAFAIVDEGLKLSPEDARLNYHIGRLAAVSGQQLDRGLAALDKVHAMPDKADDYSEGGALWRRAMILEKLGRAPEALADYRRAMRIEPMLKEQIEKDIARVQGKS